MTLENGKPLKNPSVKLIMQRVISIGMRRKQNESMDARFQQLAKLKELLLVNNQ